MNRFLLFVLLLVISPMFLCAQADESKPVRVSKAVAYAKSPPLAELAAFLSPDKAESLIIKEVKNHINYNKWPNDDLLKSNAHVQIEMGNYQSYGPLVGFAGQGGTGSFPPDTDGDVSETHFIQVVNAKYNVYLKDGTKVLGPLNLSTLWASLPGPWVGSNHGDPIVLYDEIADRWLITQFYVPNSGNNYELFAVSETGDPLGSYHLYAFSFGSYMNDYPKIGVWPDGYYVTYNMFSSSFIGTKVTCVERDKMLDGDEDASMIEYLKNGKYAMMPADVDGEMLPETGAPCPIMFINNAQNVEMWDFHVDWDNTSNSSLNLGTTINVSSFSSLPNTNNGVGGFVTQPGTTQKLDGLGAMIMYRLAYRNFDTHESMVTTHSVRVNEGSGVYRAAIRWYEFRKTSGNWIKYQEGTYAPDDNHRWMGSAAMNIDGDIAIGYSVSNSDDVYPSIRYTGRRAGDPLGEMTVEEVELKTGTTSQNHWRWGDYSCMNVDPADDTTFWFTTEYNGWKTWIASFDLGGFNEPNCSAGEDAYICQNDQFQTQGTGEAALEIEWTSDGDGFFSPNDQFITTYIRGGQDVNNGGCSLTLTVTGYDGTSTSSDEMYLNIIPVVSAGNNAEILDTEVFTCEGSTNAPDGTIMWTTSGDGSFSDAHMLGPIYTPGSGDIDNGDVTLNLEVTITEPCEDTEDDDMVLTILPVGINQLNKTTSLSIYPNPSNGIFTININELPVGKEFSFFVYTSYGKEVYRQVIQAKSSSYDRIINMSDFTAGVYYITVKSDQGNTTRKILKK